MFWTEGEKNSNSLFSPVITLWGTLIALIIMLLHLYAMGWSVIAQSDVFWSCSLVNRRLVPGVIKFFMLNSV